MQIQLKQAEIELALKGYIIAQGINLTGKTVAYAFTSGRKDNGLTVDLDISDIEIPGFTNAAPAFEAPTLALVAPIQLQANVEPAVEVVADVPAPVLVEEVAPEAVVEVSDALPVVSEVPAPAEDAQAEVKPEPVASLFG